MARQGNYVTLASANPNWASGVSGALADLSRSLTSQSDAEKERDRLAAADIENRRRYEADKAYKADRDLLSDAQYNQAQAQARHRFDTENAYKASEESRRKQEYDSKLAKQEWLKKMPSTYSKQALQKRKAQELGYSGEGIPERTRDDILSKVPLYREDIERFLGADYLSTFGETADNTLFAPVSGTVSSSRELQEKENTRTKELQAQADKDAAYRLQYAKLFSGDASGTSTPKGSKKGSTRSLADISSVDLAKAYEGNSWFNPAKSEKQETKAIVDSLIQSFESTNLASNPAAVEAGIKFALNNLTEGGDLNRINYDKGKAEELATKGANLYLASTSKGGSGNFRPGAPENLVTYAPSDVVQERLKAWRALLNPPAVTETAPAVEKPAIGRDILGNLGVKGGNEPKIEVPIPADAQALTVGKPELTPQELDAKRNNMFRYSMSNDLVRQADKLFGADGFKHDTILVQPFDAKGDKRPWDDVVKDINSRNGIAFGDKIDREEYEAAKDNPALQQEMIDRANSLIGNDLLFRTGTSRVLSGATDYLGDVYNTVRESITGFDPDSEKYANTLNTEENRKARNELLDRIDEFVRSRGGKASSEGNLSQIGNAFTDFIEESPSAQIAASTAVPLGLAGLGRLLLPAAKVVPRLLRKPAVVRSERMRPDREDYWRGLDTSPLNRSSMDDILYNRWLRSNTSPRK